MAEIELSRMALEKASTPALKAYAQTIIDDHDTAGNKLKSAVSGESIEWPAQLDEKHTKAAGELGKAQAADFDREYVKMMVKDHEEDVAAFKRESQQAQDPDLKAWVAKTLPTLEDHLKSIKQIESQVARQ